MILQHRDSDACESDESELDKPESDKPDSITASSLEWSIVDDEESSYVFV